MNKSLSLAKKELGDILSERVYIFAFVVQVIIVMGIVYAALLYTSVASPETRVFILPEKPRVGVIGEWNALVSELDDLDIVYLTGDAMKELRKRGLVAVLVIPESFQKNIESGEGTEITLVLDNTNILSGFADAMISRAVEGQSKEIEIEWLSDRFRDPDIILSPINIEEIYVNEKVLRPPFDSPEFIEIMYGLLIPFILLLPTFLATNMVTDSIVGEKERKTYEILIAAPITKRSIIFGKTMPILLISILQAFFWILILGTKGIVIYNVSIVLGVLLLLDLIFIGFGIAISALSENIKESNLSVTVLLIAASLSFFIPLSIKKEFYQFSPVSLISKLSSNPSVNPGEVIVPFVLFAITGMFVVILGEKLLERKESLRL